MFVPNCIKYCWVYLLCHKTALFSFQKCEQELSCVPQHNNKPSVFRLSCFGDCLILIATVLNWKTEEQQSELMKNCIRSRHAVCQFPDAPICQSTARYQEIVMLRKFVVLFVLCPCHLYGFFPFPLPCTTSSSGGTLVLDLGDNLLGSLQGIIDLPMMKQKPWDCSYPIMF